MKPTVGRMVHYRGGDGSCWAAVVTLVVEDELWVDQDTNQASICDTVCLNIMPPMRPAFQRTAAQGTTDGTWHWPERTND